MSVPRNEVLCCASTNLLRIRLGKNKKFKTKKEQFKYHIHTTRCVVI